MRGPLFDDDLRRHRRNVSLLGAAVLVPYFGVDLLASGPLVSVMFARAGWIASLLIGALLLRRESAVSPRVTEAILTSSTTAATVVLVSLTGGPSSGYFGFLFALPFCIALLLPGALWCAGLSGVATLVSGGVLLLRSGAPPVEIVQWTSSSVAAAFLATYATRASLLLLERRFDAEVTRAGLAEQLAESTRRLATAERLAMAGRLAAGVAHEVNNPLAFVKSNLQWARSRLAEEPIPRGDRETMEALAEAELGVQRIARIVEDLRTFCRPPPAAPCGVDVAVAVDEALRIARPRLGAAEVLISVVPDLPEALICRGRLVQVLVNLLVNAGDALEAVPAGAPRWISVQGALAPGGVLVSVTDSGPGFPAEVLPRVFDPFFTTKPVGRGTGLGLALAHEYASVAGGTIAARNAPGAGARVELTLRPARRGERARCVACEYARGDRADGVVSLQRAV